VKADRKVIDEVVQRLNENTSSPAATGGGSMDPPLTTARDDDKSPWHGLWLMGAGMVIGAICLRAGSSMPKTQSPSAARWAFIFVTIGGIALSLTPAAKLERYGASRWGYFCLYLLLAAIGSKARLQYILQAPLLIVMAYTWVLIHAVTLAVYGYFCRVPMF